MGYGLPAALSNGIPKSSDAELTVAMVLAYYRLRFGRRSDLVNPVSRSEKLRSQLRGLLTDTE